MKRFLVVLALLFAAVPFAAAQNKLNDNADSIIGEYMDDTPGDGFKCRFSKNADGSYKCQVTWIENNIDPSTGKPWLDVHNPDKSLRNRRNDSLVIIENIKYNPAKKHWDGAKIYDPDRGIKANVTCVFTDDGRLCLKGTVLGIGEKVYWKKL